MSELTRTQKAVLCITAGLVAVCVFTIAVSQVHQAAALEQIAAAAATIAAQGKPPILFKLDDGPAQAVLANALQKPK